MQIFGLGGAKMEAGPSAEMGRGRWQGFILNYLPSFSPGRLCTPLLGHPESPDEVSDPQHSPRGARPGPPGWRSLLPTLTPFQHSAACSSIIVCWLVFP